MLIVNGARYVTKARMTKSSAWKWSLLWIGTSTRDQQLWVMIAALEISHKPQEYRVMQIYYVSILLCNIALTVF